MSFFLFSKPKTNFNLRF